MQMSSEILVPVPARMNIHLLQGQLSEVISHIGSSCHLHSWFPEVLSCTGLHQTAFFHSDAPQQ